jgi:tRNA (guanine-N7-)-methyltransferase
MVTGAEYLLKYFPENSVERIYLNFSCPFPKARYAKHRLTSPIFLPMYKHILKNGCEIHQKTDNMHFFEYSLERYSELGFIMQNISLDLHKSNFEGNIITEYEKRFTDLGQPIYRVEAICKK